MNMIMRKSALLLAGIALFFAPGAAAQAGEIPPITIGNGATVTQGDDISITTTGDGEKAISFKSYEGNLTVGNNAAITTKGANSYGITGKGLVTYMTNEATFGENAKFTAEGADSVAVHAGYATKYTFGNGAVIRAADPSSLAIEAVNGGSAVTFNGDATIHAANQDALAVKAYRDDGKSAGPSVTAVAGVADVLGSLEAGDYGYIVLNMQDGSRFTGYTALTGDNTWSTGGGQVNLTLNDDSVWNVTKDSTAYFLYLNKTGETAPVVKFGDYDTIPENSRKGTTPATPLADRMITLELLSLNASSFSDAYNNTGGHFLMRTDIANQLSDKIVVRYTSSGQHEISVKNDGSAATTGKEIVTLVTTPKDNGFHASGNPAPASFSLTNKVDLGAWRYDLHYVDAGDTRQWQLYSSEELPVNPTDPTNPTDPSEPSKPEPSSPGSAAINTFIAGYLLNYAETNTLIQRLGDLRSTPLREGAWFRGYGGKFENDGREYAKEFDMDYGGVQVGYDHRLENSAFKNGRTYVGAFVGFGNADLDYLQNGSGSGGAENRTLGMYATYVGDNGFYVDTIAKYSWSKLNFDVLDSEGTLVTGDDVNLGGVGLSLETGKRIRFGNKTAANRGSWYVEPQLQLSWQHTGSGSFTASNGLEIGLDSYESLLGRAGLLFGYETARTNVYAKVSYVKEFDGDMNIVANGVNIPESMDDDWLVYGVGVTRQVNPRSALYLDVERASEGRFTQEWAVKGGWRISF